jgi:Na+/proline symporter
MTFLDWSIIAAYFVVAAAIGLALARRGGRSMSDYFVSGVRCRGGWRGRRWWPRPSRPTRRSR